MVTLEDDLNDKIISLQDSNLSSIANFSVKLGKYDDSDKTRKQMALELKEYSEVVNSKINEAKYELEEELSKF